MKSILNVWETALIGIFMFVVLISQHFMKDIADGIQFYFGIEDHRISYVLYFIIVLLMLIIEQIERSASARRIKCSSCKMIYKSRRIIDKYHIQITSILVLAYLCFIVLSSELWQLITLFVIMIISIFSKDKSVYATEELLIIDGIIYFRNSVTEWMVTNDRMVICYIRGKRRTINCSSKDRFSEVVNWFNQYCLELGADANDCT